MPGAVVKPEDLGRPGVLSNENFLQMPRCWGVRLSNRSRGRIAAIRSTAASSRKVPMICDCAVLRNCHARFRLFRGFFLA